MTKILFVCKGNIYRSQLAMHLARQIIPAIDFDSAGIFELITGRPTKHVHISEYPEEFEKASTALSQFEISLWQNKSKPLTVQLASSADLIIVFDQELKENVVRLFPDCTAKIFLLSELVGVEKEISDPFGKPLEEYLQCTKLIVRFLAMENFKTRLGVGLYSQSFQTGP